jgi:RNA polymerase sigma-70 factor, ECF subfamily
MTESDAALLRKTAGGDRSALETILDRHDRAVFRLARALTGNDATAEDVLQETFLAVWRNAGAFDGSDSARPWILTIARNAAHRQFRRRAGEPAALEPLGDGGGETGWGTVDADFAERVADRELVRIGFDGLLREEREVLMLRDVEGFSGEEVANILGLTLPAMKSRLHRARLHFVANLRRSMHA